MMRDTSTISAKTVLLIDLNPRTLAARAKVMRQRGMMVDCAATVTLGLSCCRAGHYNLVLIDLAKDLVGADRLVADIKRDNPRQLVALLVGKPPYIVKYPKRAGAKTLPPVVSIDFGQRPKQAQTEAEDVA